MPSRHTTEDPLAPELEAITTAAADRLRAQADSNGHDDGELQRRVADAASAAITAGLPLGANRGRRAGWEALVTPGLPSPPSVEELLALLTRVRCARVATGELDQRRVYDLRAFKSCVVALAYLYRLAGSGRRGATVVTSMHQLVAGLAALHPCWTLSGDRRQDRDRHRSSVGSQLGALDAAGVLRWQVGVDAGQEQHHTELVLLPVPELLPGELAAAAVQLARWEARYGRGLNTGARMGIADVARLAPPLVW